MQRPTRVNRDSAGRERKSEVISSSVIARDMQATGYGELRKALEEIERLKQSNAGLQRFTAVVSHDLREPLRMMFAYAQLLAERYRGKLDADADEFLNFITGGARWMTQLISDLLDYSKTSTEPSRFVTIDSQQSLSFALRNLRMCIAEVGAIIRCDALPKVLANNQLTLVFQNLISNAMKYRGQATPEIQVSAQCGNDGYCCFSVADNGIGFDMAHAEKLFNPFYRVRDTEEFAGTGMGLAICHGIVHQLGGRIWVQSEPGKGSTFFFTVRVSPEDSPSELFR